MEIKTYLKQDHYLIVISGRVDADQLDTFDSNLEKCLDLSVPAILVDCYELTHVCVPGLRSLLRFQKLFQNQKKTIILFGLKLHLESIFFETGLDRFIVVRANYQQALNLVRKS